MHTSPIVALDDGLSRGLIQLARQHAGERVRLLLKMVHHYFSSEACMGKTREPRTGLASLCHRFAVLPHIRQLKPTVRSLSQKDRRIALLLAARVLLKDSSFRPGKLAAYFSNSSIPDTQQATIAIDEPLWWRFYQVPHKTGYIYIAKLSCLVASATSPKNDSYNVIVIQFDYKPIKIVVR
jgi:hypothetical protein